MGSYFSLPLSLISVLIENPFLYNVCYAASFIYLKLRQKLKGKRFDLYDFKVEGKPYKNGFFIPQEEWKLESPNETCNFSKFSDSAFCFATSPKNEYIGIHISKLPHDRVRCSVTLRTSDGRQFHLPNEHVVQKSTLEDNTFGSSRLKLQCLLPMRKWRVFFNGILEENGVPNAEKFKHVKFSFLWSPSADVFDFTCDMSEEIILKHAASQRNLGPIDFLQRLRKMLNSYHHPGMFNGTLKIENEEEKVIYLWGVRGRYMGDLLHKQSNCVKIFGNFHNGSSIFLAIMDIPGVLKSFPYGYLMWSDGTLFPISEISSKENSFLQTETNITFTAENRTFSIKSKQVKSNKNNPQNGNNIWMIKTLDLNMNGNSGSGFFIEGHFDGQNSMKNRESTVMAPTIQGSTHYSDVFTVPFTDHRCQDSSLTGGKGSSLAKLLKLSILLKTNIGKPEYTVPNGIVVTTTSYEEFTKGELKKLLQTFERNVWKGKDSAIPGFCKNIMENVGSTKVPGAVAMSILSDLRKVFGDSVEERKFSVRSSATGEDTEQMSAAGQMETFLGVQGFNEILKSISKCWASQFSFQAVEYKRRYGQKLNTPMAVVIQEMISCEAAGVMFTCDPVTGNPSFINITGNWGLGESVVSGSAEPDTIKLKKEVNNKLQFHNQVLGEKKTQTVLDSFGTKDVDVTDEQSKNCCVTEDIALKLGHIAVEIEQYYGCPQDTEWGVLDGNIFFFQSRPVTTIDIDTEYETKHFFDTYQRTANEYFSKANVGEGFPGAISILGMDSMWKLTEVNYGRQKVDFDTQLTLKKPYYMKKGAIITNQVFFAMLEGFFSFDSEPNAMSKSMLISMFGRLIDDTDMRRIAKERFALRKTRKVPLWEKIYLFSLLFVSGILTKRKTKEINNIKLNCMNSKDAKELYKIYSEEYDKFWEALEYHMHCTFTSGIWNLPLLSTLAESNNSWNHVTFTDFSKLLKTNSKVLSADVPAAMEDLAKSISLSMDPETFKKFTAEEAIKWLKTTTTEAGTKFKNFMKVHGHRCIKEFDVFSETWGMNPTPLIFTLQDLVSQHNNYAAGKKSDSIFKIIASLQTKLSLLDKLKFLFIIPNARRAVGDREISKSLLIKAISNYRQPLHRLAGLMVKEGRLPYKEMMFFLCVEEINMLLNTRSPKLVSKAFRRWKYQKDLDNLLFPELMVGNPVPINQTEERVPTEEGFTMTGVPVSQGISKARACVIMSVNEANEIQNGDILITYSTDIAWSPYFTRLSGVVTELGGLISHGAVVAREYGLPCVVALHGATKAFKTGDIVLLDGNKGILQKVK